MYASGAYPFALRSVRADGTERETLYRSEDTVSFPDVSPDDRLIAFDRGAKNEIWLMNRDGSDAHFVTAGTTPRFSPDGIHLAIGGPATQEGRVELDIVNLDGSGRQPIAFDAAPFPQPAWSPDGKMVAFVGYLRIQFDFPAIKVVAGDGSDERFLDERFLAGPLGESPRWSPDGTAIAYTNGGDRSFPKTIHIVGPDGRGDHAVGPRNKLDAIAPAWSVTGRQLTYLAAPAGVESQQGELWRVDRSGRGRHPIAASCRFGTGSADHIRGSVHSDHIFGLEGNDVIDVRRGGRDFVDCGPGRDIVHADRRDLIGRDCERVRRRH